MGVHVVCIIPKFQVIYYLFTLNLHRMPPSGDTPNALSMGEDNSESNAIAPRSRMIRQQKYVDSKKKKKIDK